MKRPRRERDAMERLAQVVAAGAEAAAQLAAQRCSGVEHFDADDARDAYAAGLLAPYLTALHGDGREVSAERQRWIWERARNLAEKASGVSLVVEGLEELLRRTG